MSDECIHCGIGMDCIPARYDECILCNPDAHSIPYSERQYV